MVFKCTACKKEQPMSEYYKNNKTKTGFTTQCKTCMKIAGVKNNIKAREKLALAKQKKVIEDSRRE